MTDKRYQVFISSTYTDLIDERREVMQAVLEMDAMPAGMELFPAANDDQWTLIKGVIEQSDYYLIIVGGRYGSTTEEGISYTEKEYDFAIDLGIPVMGFVHADPNQIIAGKTELEPGAREKLDTFREKVKQKMIKSYTSPSDLGSVVSRALNRMMRTTPREGWVRGSEAMTEETKTEIAELKAALANALKDKAESAVAKGPGSELNLSYHHGSDLVELELVAGVGPGYARVRYDGSLEYDWDEIIQTLGPFMIDEAPEPSLRSAWNAHMLRDLQTGSEGWPTEAYTVASITDSSWANILVQLRALGIMKLGEKKRTVSDRAVYWTLTPAGDEYLVGLRATKRPII
jgi:hypothetical protein